MTSLALYEGVLVALVAERGAELAIAARNTRWSRRHGGVEEGRTQYRVIVAMHVAFLASAALEPIVLDRPFVPALGWPALAVALLCQGVRWWCIATLGRRWNTRIIVVPGAPRVTTGPYRWLDHPNYAAVAVEIAAVPSIHTAWLTSLAFSILNAAVLRHRIRIEDDALRRHLHPTTS